MKCASLALVIVGGSTVLAEASNLLFTQDPALPWNHVSITVWAAPQWQAESFNREGHDIPDAL